MACRHLQAIGTVCVYTCLTRFSRAAVTPKTHQPARISACAADIVDQFIDGCVHQLVGLLVVVAPLERSSKSAQSFA